MAATSKVKICNLALTLIGADTINAIDDDSTPAKKCNAIYDYILEDLLTSCPWTFAQKRVALALLDEDPVYTDDGVAYVYQKPTDCLKVNFTNVENALVKIEGDKILSDTASLYIMYTYNVTDPTKYTPKFTTALAGRLAAELAFPITNSRTLAADLMNVYLNEKLPDAVASDSQQGTPLAPAQDEWLFSRMHSSSAISGRTTWDTWYPCCCY